METAGCAGSKFYTASILLIKKRKMKNALNRQNSVTKNYVATFAAFIPIHVIANA
jgi:hypothetical protein